MQAGGLAAQSVDVLHEYASLPRGSTPGTHCSSWCNGSNATNCHEQCGLRTLYGRSLSNRLLRSFYASLWHRVNGNAIVCLHCKCEDPQLMIQA